MCWFAYLEQQEKERKRERERQEVHAFFLFQGWTKDELIFQVLLFFLSGGCQLATFTKMFAAKYIFICHGDQNSHNLELRITLLTL